MYPFLGAGMRLQQQDRLRYPNLTSAWLLS
jgi:hypothetical protein